MRKRVANNKTKTRIISPLYTEQLGREVEIRALFTVGLSELPKEHELVV